LIGVIALAATLIALLSMYSLQPKIAYERGHLQAAQLVHLARACMAAGAATTRSSKNLWGASTSSTRRTPYGCTT